MLSVLHLDKFVGEDTNGGIHYPSGREKIPRFRQYNVPDISHGTIEVKEHWK